MKTFRNILLLSLVFSFFAAGTASARVDQRCFAKSDCIQSRKTTGFNLTNAEVAQGFRVDAVTKSICGEKMRFNGAEEPAGFCSPVGETITQIGFGGKTSFDNVAVFIQYMYQYGVMVAGLLAVLVIIVAGLQWTMSGGNTSVIDGAKKRIAGAFSGLILAVLAFTILNTISPYLVNLRLPQAWMINQVILGKDSCEALETGTLLSLFVDDNVDTGKLSSEQTDAYVKKAQYTISSENAPCGGRYLIDGLGKQSCVGHSCGRGFVCVQKDKKQKSTCELGQVGGTISGSDNFFLENRKGTYIDNDLYVMLMCMSGKVHQLAFTEAKVRSSSDQYYIFDKFDPSGGLCKNDGGVAGYYIIAEVNDKSGLASIGNDDWMAIGRSPTDNTKCDVNLSAIALSISGEKACGSGDSRYDCSCLGVAIWAQNRADRVADIVPYLIHPDDIRGVSCNIVLSRSSFPDLTLTLGSQSRDCELK